MADRLSGKGAIALPHVVVVMARCQRRGGTFGVRFEETTPGRWVADWAFPIAEAAGRREGWDRTTLEGRFGFAPEYPGCPWCEARGVFHCGRDARHVGCWDGVTARVRCPWCEQRTEIDGDIERLSGGGDR